MMPSNQPPLCITTHTGAPGRSLAHAWSVCVGAGRANEGLRADWQQHLRLSVRECGFRYLRFHGLFHDDMFVYREDEHGQPIYNWQYIDALFDPMLEIGIRPFVELGFCPGALASGEATVFWWKGRIDPPKDVAKWADLVRAFIRHCISRYGLDEVRQWYFEVWNEPNLYFFFSGTWCQYFELYRATAQAIKTIDPALRVGGPATSNFSLEAQLNRNETGAITRDALLAEADGLVWQPVWVEKFLAWCGERQVPVDFVSTHPYPTDWPLDVAGERVRMSRKREAIHDDLRLLRAIVDRSSYPQAEIHCTEWSSSPSPRDHSHDFPQAATYIVMANLEATTPIDSLAYWVFTDVFEENGAGNTIWHGGFGLINLQGIPKPAFHAYRFLHRLGTEVLAQESGAIVTRHADGRMTALLYHYPAEVTSSLCFADTPDDAHAMLAMGTPREAHITVHGQPPHAAFSVETLDAQHGWARGAWEAMGSPEPPSREAVEQLRQMSHPHVQAVTADAQGTLTVSLTLSPWAVVLIDQLM